MVLPYWCVNENTNGIVPALRWALSQAAACLFAGITNMHSRLLFTATLLFTAGISSALTYILVRDDVADDAVYVVGAATITDPDRLPEYQAIARPLAEKTGGYVPVAFSEPTMIEGPKPATGLYFVERYDSIEGLNAFIESKEFREAKVLRDQVADVHFMLVIDAYRH